MAHPLKHTNPLKVEELRHIPFKSNFVQVGSVTGDSGYSPDGPTPSYDFVDGVAIHNPYIRPFHITSDSFVLPPNNQSNATPFLSLDFAEFVNLDNRNPEQVVYSTIRVVAFHRLQSQDWLRQRTVTDVLAYQNIPNNDFKYSIDVITQGKVRDSSRSQLNINLQIQLVNDTPSSPTADLRMVFNNPIPTAIGGQKIVSKGYIKYIG
jgi:hypothetical protein